MLRQSVTRFCFSAFLAFGCVSAFAGALSQDFACAQLLEAATKKHFAIENSAGGYRCEPYFESKRHFVFQLHYAGGEPEGWVGSTLAGYYAVRKNDRAVLIWDFANDVPGKIMFRPRSKSGGGK